MTTTTQQLFSIPLKIFICLLLTFIVSYPIEAEDSSTSPFPIVEVDLNAGVFKNVLPFDVPFLITGQVTNDINEVSVRYFESDSVISNKSIQPNE